MSKSFVSTFGITVKQGAAHNSITRNGKTHDMSSTDSKTRRLHEDAMARGVVNLGGWAKPGSDRNRNKRQRKGYAHA